MSQNRGFDFPIMETGVPNLDIVLGGGLPVGSFNLIAGGPGAGKTILSQQMMFHNATVERQALHFTVLGEPVAKLMRYQSRFSFFDASKVNTAVRYVDIGDVIRKEGLERGLEVIISRVERYAPSIIIIDSVRAVREISRREGEYGLRSFAHDLAQVAVVWAATSFMIGEYEESELRAGPEFTMADGILWMTIEQSGNSALRKLQVIKSRGMNIVQGLHSFRIDGDGVYVYPRLAPPAAAISPDRQDRVSLGVRELDRMMEGGIPRGETCLIAGASGTGKSVLAQHFVAEGIARGENCVAVIFEDTPEEYEAHGAAFGWEIGRWRREGKLSVLYRGSIDVAVDEVIHEAHRAVTALGARRLVLDSISGFELARSPADRSNFRESIQRMIGWLTGTGVTALMTTEITEMFGELRFSTHAISFIADNILLLRYVELESELRKMVTVVKMRGSAHDRELRHLHITERGVSVGPPLREYTGLLSGVPSLVAVVGPQPFAPGLEPMESALVDTLFGLGRSTPEGLAAATSLPRAEVEGMLERLVSMGYVVREQSKAGPLYHVTMVSWAPSLTRPRPRRRGGQGGQDSVEG